MTPTFKKHRPQPCLADQPVHLAAAATHSHIWEMHVGWIQLFIAGPGPDAWLACSESYYYGQVGTEDERNLARRAVAILAVAHRQNNDAGPNEIRAALELARTQSEPIPAHDDCEISQLAPEPKPAPNIPSAKSKSPVSRPQCGKKAGAVDPAAILAVIQAVADATGLSPADFVGRDRAREICHARHLAIATVWQEFPQLTSIQLSEIFHRGHSAMIKSRDESTHLLQSNSDYQRLHARVHGRLLSTDFA